MSEQVIKYRGKIDGEWLYITPDDVSWGMFWLAVDRKTVGQYTGLKDKNGVEIYKGDIVQVEGYAVGSIQYGKAVFFVDFANGHKLALEDTCQEWLKVLGNMCEFGLDGAEGKEKEPG